MKSVSKITIVLFITFLVHITLNSSRIRANYEVATKDSVTSISKKEYQNKMALAKECTHLFKMDSAISIYEYLYKTDSSQLDVTKELESLYTKTSQYDKALHYANKILNQESQNRYYYIRKGLLLKKLNENDLALLIFKSAFVSDTSNTFLITQIADIFREMNQPDSAVYYYSKSCDINPITSNLIKSTDILLKNKQNKEALSFLQKYYVPENHTSKVLSHFVGKTWYLNDSIYNAYSVFNDLYQQGDSSKVTTKYLGLCCWKNTYYSKGEEAFKDFISQDSTDFLAYYVLGICCKHTNKLEESNCFFNKSLELYLPDIKTENMIYKGIAEVHEQKGQYKKAIEYYKIIADNDTKNLYADYKIAMTYDFAIKDKTKALKCYQALLNRIKNSNPNSDSLIKNYCEIRIELINEEIFWNKDKALNN